MIHSDMNVSNPEYHEENGNCSAQYLSAHTEQPRGHTDRNFPWKTESGITKVNEPSNTERMLYILAFPQNTSVIVPLFLYFTSRFG